MELHVLDKSDWGPGPWQDEPDRAEWRDEKTGLPCLAIRHRDHGNWCGYVAVPGDHPWATQDPMRIRLDGTEHPVHPDEGWDDRDYDEIAIEITYGPAPCDPDDSDPLRVCHVPQPGERDDVRWIGFDFGHSGDYQPGYRHKIKGDTYKDLSCVKEHCTRFSAQVKQVQMAMGAK